MKKRSPPPHDDRLPAMFVGDLQAPPPPALLARPEVAALLPDDLRVSTEGASTGRIPWMAVPLLIVLLVGLTLPDAMYDYMPTPGERASLLAGTAAVCALLGWLGHRYVVRHRKEYRLTDEGIVQEVWHGVDNVPWVTRIPWTEIEDYTVSVDYEAVHLRVRSVRGYTLNLRDAPPRLSTRELIRRFVEQAERHPRAVRPAGVGGAVERAITGEIHPVFLTGFIFFVALWIVGKTSEDTIDLSFAQQVVGWTALVVIVMAWGTWIGLHDSDVADADRTAKGPMARLRRWLRRVLDIRVI